MVGLGFEGFGVEIKNNVSTTAGTGLCRVWGMITLNSG